MNCLRSLLMAFAVCGGLAGAPVAAQVSDPGSGNATGLPASKPKPSSALKFGPELKSLVIEKIDEIIDARCYAAGVDFSKWGEIKDTHRKEFDDAANQDQFAGALSHALGDFGISHFRVQSPKAAAQRNRSSMVGVGVSLKVEADGLRIMSVVSDGPAATAGLKAGDTITLVDGEAATRPEMLRGEEGTNVELHVRSEDGQEEDFIITRKEFSTLRKDSLRWFDESTAVLKINSFAVGYSRENIASFIHEAQGKAQNLVLDLRNNGGGTTVALNHLLSHLLPAGTEIGTSVSRSLARRFEENTKGDSKDAVAIAAWSKSKWKTRQRVDTRFEGRIAVLINGATGSASEITAAALRELRDAPIVGSPSAGAVLVSTFTQLPGGFAMQIPVEDYVTIKGMRLEKHPIVPDVELSPVNLALDADVTDDPVIVKAVALLRARTDPPAAEKQPDAAEPEPK